MPSRFFHSIALAVFLCLAAQGDQGMPQTPTSWVSAESDSAATAADVDQLQGGVTAPNPQDVLGNDACVKCHPNEVAVWQNTPHAKTFQTLHRRPEAQEIAKRLGLNSIKHSGRCVSCHYTEQASAEDVGIAHVVAGVSCESCHGAARNWVETHHNYGGPSLTRLTESPEHREQRIRTSIELGMRNPTNHYLVAQSCLRCHTTQDETLVNVGGHSVGSLDFEFVSWSQGTVRHNFLEGGEHVNATRSPSTLRVMFVVGMVAELEASLRATALATQKANFGVTAAQRADRAAKRLASVASKVDVPRVREVLEVYGAVTLKLNNEAELTEAADKIAGIGYAFAASADGEAMAALDPFIPRGRK